MEVALEAAGLVLEGLLEGAALGAAGELLVAVAARAEPVGGRGDGVAPVAGLKNKDDINSRERSSSFILQTLDGG